MGTRFRPKLCVCAVFTIVTVIVAGLIAPTLLAVCASHMVELSIFLLLSFATKCTHFVVNDNAFRSGITRSDPVWSGLELCPLQQSGYTLLQWTIPPMHRMDLRVIYESAILREGCMKRYVINQYSITSKDRYCIICRELPGGIAPHQRAYL